MKQTLRHWLKYASWPAACGLLLGLLLVSQLSGDGSYLRNTSYASHSYAKAVKRAAPAVVNIYTSTIIRQHIHPFFQDPYFRQFLDRLNARRLDRIQRSLGSGVILSPEGFILTNLHVIKNADAILVQLYDGRESLATIVGTDSDTDLAVLKIDLPNLPVIPINERRIYSVGDIVLAIGNPYGLEQTVTQGIISATGRHGLNINTYENFIQTDAAINPGNSGGALIDVEGNLIGINSNIVSSGAQGIGLAIPTETAMRVLADIIQHGRVIRGWLGLEAQLLTTYAAKRLGASELAEKALLITATAANGPAHRAGLLPGDIVTRIGKQEIVDGRTGMSEVANLRPGEEVKISIIRDGKAMELTALVGTRPESA